jgi:PTS system N-acetylgalactosamine-specific EIIC component, Man family (TC 4.A.6.1.4)
MSGVMSRCDRMAANADTRGIERVNYLALLALGTFYFSVLFCLSTSAQNTPKPQ